MRNIALYILILFLTLATNGCVSISKTNRVPPFEVSAVDVCAIESSVHTVHETGITTTKILTKQVVVEIERTGTAEPFDDVAFTLKREDSGWRSVISPAANLNVYHGRRDRYRVTFLVDERDVPSKDIVVQVDAGGVTTFVVFNRNPAPGQPRYACFKQTGRTLAEWQYGAWARINGRRFLIEETPLETLVAARAN